ncbi:MAG: hypothetical protein ACR2Q3_06980 [Woeseiaceae bacterium]
MSQMFERVTLSGMALLLSLTAHAEPDLSGIWMLAGRVTESEVQLTDEALRIQANYDLLSDDPSLYCEPASTSRVWANPNVRIAFDQSTDRILISYEFYDLRRDIPLGVPADISGYPSTRNVDGTHFSKMGSSVAWYEDNHLLIETRNHSRGYIRTSRGIPQSENSVTTERLWIENGDLRLTLTYVDDLLFDAPFVLEHRFEKLESSELPLYNCTDADYDWFEKLNAPATGESS